MTRLAHSYARTVKMSAGKYRVSCCWWGEPRGEWVTIWVTGRRRSDNRAVERRYALPIRFYKSRKIKSEVAHFGAMLLLLGVNSRHAPPGFVGGAEEGHLWEHHHNLHKQHHA